MNRRTLTTVAVVALLATSGCTSLGLLDGGTESPPDVDVDQRFDSLETIQATQVSTMTSGGETNETRTLVRADFTGDGVRQYQRTLEPPERAGDRIVVNESDAVIYDASENDVTRVPRMNGTQQLSRGEYFADIVAAAHSDDGRAPAAGVSPLPVVPPTGGAPSVPSDAIEGFEVEYLGTQSIAGRTAHGFEMTSASEAALSVNRTLWLDSEFYYPLKTHQTLDTGNRTIEVTAELRNVTFNEAIPDETFEFDVPANATVDTLDISSKTFDSIAALREHVDFTVPEPPVPEEYEFQRARYIGGNATQASLQYANSAGDRLVVSKMTYVSNASGGFASGENVTVAGQQARYVTTGTAKILTWKCEASQFSVVATDLEQEQLIAVAESVGCN
jgi:outer membrane lipoprotein-sorting protein